MADEFTSGISLGSTRELGSLTWAIAEGYIPEWSTGPEPEMESHETLCFLNSSARDARVELWIYFSDKEPVGPYRLAVPARRTSHVRLNDLSEPQPIPKGTDFACVVSADVPVVVQHTRLDSRQTSNSIMTTMAFPMAAGATSSAAGVPT